MRFRRSQLLKHVSQKQLLEYQKEIGFVLMDHSHEEISISEMVAKLYSFLRYSGNMMMLKHNEPTEYLNKVDTRKRIALDISRCLVTAKKLGEDLDKCPPAEELFDYMIRDMSLHARVLSERAISANFGLAYNEAAYTLYSEVCTLIRRLKVTRQGYHTIKTVPGAVLCESQKSTVSEKLPVNTVTENEPCVRPERPISPMPTTVIPESEQTADETHQCEMQCAEVTIVSEENNAGSHTDPIKNHEKPVRETTNGSLPEESDLSHAEILKAIRKQLAESGRPVNSLPYGKIKPYGRDYDSDLWKNEDNDEYDSEPAFFTEDRVRSKERLTA